jgi:hypothetical protein
MPITNLSIQSSETRLVRPLKVLTSLILQDIKAAAAAEIPHFASAGEKLWEAKVYFADDSRTFNEWATKSFDCSQSTVKRWMTYAVETNGGQLFSFQQDAPRPRAINPQPQQFKTLSEVTEPNRNSRHAPNWYQPVQEIRNQINVPRMMQEKQDKDREAKLQRQLGMQLIDIGYKVLASKLHPDKGGSREAMARLPCPRRLSASRWLLS